MAAVTFNHCAQRGRKMKALCVLAGGWLAGSWQFARLPNHFFLIHLVSGEVEMLGSSQQILSLLCILVCMLVSSERSSSVTK